MTNIYNKERMKTLRTNVDGFATCKIKDAITLEKGAVVEIAGEPEVYKVQEVIDKIPNNPSFKFYKERKYDEVVDLKIMKLVDLTQLTKTAKIKLAEDLGEEFKENKYKENYQFEGVGLQFDGRLSKNQTVRMGDKVLVITDLIKPEVKGEPTKIVGNNVARIILDPVYRLYMKNKNNELEIIEYSNQKDALLSQVQLFKKENKRTFL